MHRNDAVYIVQTFVTSVSIQNAKLCCRMKKCDMKIHLFSFIDLFAVDCDLLIINIPRKFPKN